MSLLINISNTNTCQSEQYKHVTYAQAANPNIPYDILDAVLTFGGIYHYSTYAISRVHSSYIKTT